MYISEYKKEKSCCFFYRMLLSTSDVHFLTKTCIILSMNFIQLFNKGYNNMFFLPTTLYYFLIFFFFKGRLNAYITKNIY